MRRNALRLLRPTGTAGKVSSFSRNTQRLLRPAGTGDFKGNGDTAGNFSGESYESSPYYAPQMAPMAPAAPAAQ